MQRMASRGIEESDVERVVTTGEIIETYPDDSPFASRLMLAFINTRPIHVVAADNPSNNETYIITAYEAEPAEWESSFKRRICQ